MKKFISCILAAVIMCSSIVLVSANDEEKFTEGVWKYTVSNGEAAIIGTTDRSQLTLNIPESLGGYTVTEIGNYAFDSQNIPPNIVKFTKIILPKTIKRIGVRAFAQIESLKSIEINDGVEIIDDQAFISCCNLEGIKLPNSLKYIGSYAFKECLTVNWVSSLVIPAGVEYIGSYAFSEIDNLIVVHINCSLNNVGKGLFYKSGRSCSLYLSDEIKTLDLNNIFFGFDIGYVWSYWDNVIQTAKENNMEYRKSEYRSGDSDGDGNISVSDVISLRKKILAYYIPNYATDISDIPILIDPNDLDGDRKTTVTDVVMLRSKILRIG